MANSAPYSYTADVFSFATVVWEMASHERPFAEVQPEQLPIELANGARPPLHKQWPALLQSLLTQCWADHASVRPEFREIVPRMESLYETEVRKFAEKFAAKANRRATTHPPW